MRSNPTDWYWENNQKDSLGQKIFRTGDAYFGFNNKSYGDAPEIYPRNRGQRASRLLRPYRGKLILDKSRLSRIKSEMETAAKKNEIYHLWWHPHNFGIHPEKSFKELEIIFNFFKELNKLYGYKSYSMKLLPQYMKH